MGYPETRRLLDQGGTDNHKARRGCEFRSQSQSKDDGDRYCVILNFIDHSRVDVWRSSKICTPFELSDGFSSWVDSSLSFPKAQYRFIAFATREAYC